MDAQRGWGYTAALDPAEMTTCFEGGELWEFVHEPVDGEAPSLALRCGIALWVAA